MRKIKLLFVMMLATIVANAQVTGTKTIPGDYATLEAAIADLNAVGVGTGGATINLTTPQTAPSGGYLLGSAVLNATTSLSNPLVINGGGNLITAWSGGLNTLSDAVFRVSGTDYVTLNQLNIVENASNTTTTTQMERGIALMSLSATDACQFVTVQNCTINLNGATQVNTAEVGIYATHQLSTSSTAFTTMVTPSSVTGLMNDIRIRSNTITNSYNGIAITSNSSTTFINSNMVVGGPSAADGNTITNIGSTTSGNTATGYGIYMNYVGNNLVSNNTITGSGIFSTTYGIYDYYSPGESVVSNNSISLNLTTGTQIFYGIYHYNFNSVATRTRTDSNTVQNCTLAGTGTFYGIYSYMYYAIGANPIHYVRNNVLNNITRNGLSGTFYGIYRYNWASTVPVLDVRYLNNTISNINMPSMGGAQTFYGFYHVGYTGGIYRGNRITNVNINNGTSTSAQTFYLQYFYNYSGQSPNWIVDSNEVSKIRFSGPAANIFAAWAASTSTVNQFHYSRNRHDSIGIFGGATTANVEGGFFISTNSGGPVYVYNNNISNLYATAAVSDNAIKGSDITAGTATNNFFWNNTINIGANGTIGSTGANFGVTGLAFTVPVNVRNNIIRVNATPNGLGYATAIRGIFAGTAGTIHANFAAGSGNNILWVNSGTNRNLYAENGLTTAPNVFYNLTNDPNFNTSCGLFKAVAGTRGFGTFAEDNLTLLPSGVYAPSGSTYAESNAATIAQVTTDINGVTRPAFPDCGAVEFAGTALDANPPTIAFTPITSSSYCGSLPTISATITDVSGVNITAGTKPRIYFKKSTDANALVGNTSVDNGWKFVEASNAASPFTFAIDPTLLQSAPIVGDVIQYFIVAQDNATTPNVGGVTVAFANCPTSVALTSASFPTLAAPASSSMTITAPPPLVITPSANPTTACNGGSVTLTAADTISLPGIFPTTGYGGGTITSTSDDEIFRVQIAGTPLNNSSNCSTTGGGAVNGLPASLLNRYSNYTSTVPATTLVTGQAYTMNMDLSNCSGYAYSMGQAIFIDYNRNGVFDLPQERVYGSPSTNLGGISPAANTVSFSFTVPTAGSVNGPTLMRVMVVESQAGSGLIPTSSYSWGEIEDYRVNINTENQTVINSLPNNAFNWTPATNIVTNPNRTVTATNITANTTYTVTAADGGGCTVTSTILVPLAVPVVATGVTGTTTYCSATPNTTLTVQTTGGSTPINSFWLGGPVVGATSSSCLTLNGFAGSLMPANWTTLQFNSNGTVNTSGAPANVVMTSGNNASGTPGTTQFSYVSSCAGTVSFDWNYTTVHGAAYDYPQYQINSGTPQLFNGYNTAAGVNQSGTQTLSVAVGDTVKLQTYTTNNLFGACTVTISNFSAPGLAGMISGTSATLNPPVGTTTYTVIAIDACGTTSSTTVSVTVNPTPSLTMTPGNFNLCAGSTVTEVASGSGAAPVYTWMPGTLTGASQVLSPAATTIYTVTATDGPCSTTTAFTVTYIPLPVISSTNANPANVCNPGTTVLSCTDTINGPTGLVVPNSYGSATASSTTEDEILNVSLGAWSNASTCSTTGGPAGNGLPASLLNQYSNYTTSGIPVPSLNAGASVSGSITYAECSSVSGTVSYGVFIDFNRNGVWDLPAEQAVLVTGLSWPSTAPTTQNFSFTVPASAVPGQTLMRVVHMEGSVTSPTSAPTWGETEDYIVTIRKSSGLPNSSFVWTGPGTLTGNPAKSVTASNILSSSVYTITCTDLAGCTTASTVSVNMATPIIVTGVSGTTTYCSATPNTVLTVNTQNGSTPFTAVWTGGPVVSTNGMNATVNPPVGTTTYTVTVTDACGTASTTTVSVTVNPTPTVAVSPGSGNLCLGSISNQTASGSGSVPVYSWMPGSLVGPNQPLSPAANTTYTVTATDGPCSATTTLAISVVPVPVFSAVSATPNQICPGDVTSLTTAATLTVGNQGPQAYTVNSIPYTPLVPVTTVLANAGPTGDEGTTTVTLPFTFNHYGVPKNTVYIHTNGYVLFSPYVCCTYSGPAIPNAGNSNDWFGYWADLNAGAGQISYQIFGSAPNRYLVVNYNGVPYYSASTPGYSGQIVIYEDQKMDIYLANVNSSFYTSIVGTENATGTVGTAAPGLNAVYAGITNQAWRFSQFTATPVTNYAWSPAVAGAIVTPNAQTTNANPTTNITYTVTATGSNGCTATTTTNVDMKPTVSGSVNAAPSSYCVGGNSLLNGTMPVVCGPNQSNFTAYYAPATWTLTQDNANGSVNTASAPASISITSGTNSSFIEGFTNYRHTFGCSGNVTFNWSYNSADLSYSDRPRYRVNSNAEQDFPGFNQFVFATPQSGTATIAVNAGDTLTLQMYTTDNDGVAGTVVISNWNAPAEPVSGTINFWDAPVGGTLLSASPYLVAPTTTTTYYAQYNSSSSLACTNPNRVPVVVTVNQLPVLSASASPNPVCFGSPAVLTGSGASTYSWHPGGLMGAPTVFPSTTTTYTVTGIDANGCSNTASVTLAVNTLPTVSASASNTVICNGQTSTLSGTGGVSYTWEPGNLSGSPVVSPTVTTTYTMTGTDANGCNSTATVVVTVNQLPTVIASAAPTTICQNVSTSLNASGATTYSWMPGNLSGATVSDMPMATTVYTVTGTDGNGCTNTSTTTVNVNVLPTVTATNNASPICFGFTSGLSATGGVSYAWQPGNLSGSAQTVNPTTTTVYTMTATDANGCTNTATTEVVVNQLPPIVITPTLSAICLGFNTTLNVSGASTYAWQPGNLTGSPSVSPSTQTTYTVTGTDVNGCVSTSSVTIDVYLLPTITATASPSTICNGFSSTLTANGGATYSWNPGNLTGAPVVTPNANTTYTVVGTDAAGCSNTTTVSITVLTPPSVFASGPNNAFCQGGSGIIAGFSIPSIPSANFVWQPGNLVGATKNVSPATSTVYTVTATAANGCTGTATWNVQINALPIMSVTATPSNAVCMATPQVTLTANGANTYSWSGGITNGTSFNATLGNTTYTVTGTSVAGCTSTTTTTVTGNANPTVAVSATPSSICNGNTAVLTATGNGASYSWSSGGTTAQTTVQPLTNSTYTVTSTSAAGCTNTTSVNVNVTTGVFGLATTSSADTNAQPDGVMVTYTNSTCNLILSIADNIPGQTLGNTVANMTISPTVQTYNGQPYLNRWYQITPTNNIGAELKFYVNQFDFDMYNTYATANNWPLLPTGPADANGIANVRVTKVTNAGLGNNPVVLTPTSVTWNTTYGYWEIITNTPSFSQFYIHAANPNNTPLPATITRFDGRKLDNMNRLEWTTTMELNNSHFMLQYSADGNNFTDLAKLDSKAPNGNSNDVLNYAFDHTTPALGHNYYRLQQVDIDGKKSYHANVVDLIWGSNGSSVSVYPNPSQGVVNIDLYTIKAQTTNIKVLDMSGRIVKQIEARSEAGMNKLSVDLGDVAQGVYTLQVFENGQMTFVERVRKTN